MADPFTIDTFYEHIEKVIKRPAIWLGGTSLDRLEAYLCGVAAGADLGFQETRISIHSFLNHHFKKKCGSQVYWTTILRDNLPQCNDEEKIRYLYNIWPEFRIWQVMTS